LVAVIGANLVGFAGGVGGFDARATPINRSWCSDIGGKSLMISVWISFGSSWLLMALVASTFTVGGHGERYICENFTPPGLTGPEFVVKILNVHAKVKVLDEWADYLDVSKLNAQHILSACEEGTSLIKLLKREDLDLEQLVETNLAVLEDQINKTDVVQQVVSDSLKEFSVYSGNIKQEIEIVLAQTDSESLNFTVYREKVKLFASFNQNQSKETCDPDELTDFFLNSRELTPSNFLTVLPKCLENFLNSGDDSVDTAIKSAGQRLKMLGENVDFENDVLVLNSSVFNAEVIITGIRSSLKRVEKSLIEIENSLQNGDFVDELVGVIDTRANIMFDEISDFISWAVNTTSEDFGNCHAIYASYISTTTLFCDDIIDTLNGFWFSLGLCTVLLPVNIIFGVKLAKFFRKMEIEDDYEDIHIRRNVNHTNLYNSSRPSGVTGTSSYG